MEGPPLGPGREDITWPDQVAPRGQKPSSTRKIKPQTSNLKPSPYQPTMLYYVIICCVMCNHVKDTRIMCVVSTYVSIFM